MRARTGEGDRAEEDVEYASIPLSEPTATVRGHRQFSLNSSEAEFLLPRRQRVEKLGVALHPTFDLRHFVGCRVGLFAYSTLVTGGSASFQPVRIE